jgi:hypothetical protein
MKNFMAFIVGLAAVAIAPDVLDALGHTAPDRWAIAFYGTSRTIGAETRVKSWPGGCRGRRSHRTAIARLATWDSRLGTGDW